VTHDLHRPHDSTRDDLRPSFEFQHTSSHDGNVSNSRHLDRRAFHLDWAVIRMQSLDSKDVGIDPAGPQLAARFMTSIGLTIRSGKT